MSPRIREIEREVKHDVIAFVTQVGEGIGPESRFLHLGLTSSDVLDTALAVQMVEAADLLLAGCEDAATNARGARQAHTEHAHDGALARHSWRADHLWN